MMNNNKGLVSQAYEYILNMIMTKQLLPGERVPETKIAKDLGISRSPARDAMRRLENEGLIQIFPGRFAQVAEYDENALRDIGTLRVALDTMSVKLAILHGSQLDFLRLKETALNCMEAKEQNNYVLRRKLDSDFHQELARMSKNMLLLKFQNELYLRVQFLILHFQDEIDDERCHLEQHLEIAEALSAHDEKKALSTIQDHLISFYNLREYLPKDFFENTDPFYII